MTRAKKTWHKKKAEPFKLAKPPMPLYPPHISNHRRMELKAAQRKINAGG